MSSHIIWPFLFEEIFSNQILVKKKVENEKIQNNN